ncbi:MAG: N-acetylglucosamine-6-phosphate deacetylase [Eubacteriales bacterium]|nr:N-acetylglucosamine-6-phosphate deacetylase [Eubacteriales bacterium]
MIIKNALVYTEFGSFEEKNVYTEGEFLSSSSSDDLEIDGRDCYLIPGLTDIHFHGCVGHDFCDGTPESIAAIARYEASVGVTTMVPATMTLGFEKLSQICTAAAQYPNQEGAILCGINMEGPFISMERKGAQNGEYVHLPDVEMFRKLNALSDNKVKLLAIAPETEGAKEFIEALHSEVVLSAAHTTADYDCASRAFENGVHHVTHLYNAMSGLSHRAPGVVGAASDHENVEAELICDGVHIHPATVRQTFKLFGEDRLIMISDSMEATGMPDGTYSLGGQEVFKRGNLATLKDGTIAGSVTNLMDCVRTAVLQMGIPLETAIRCAAVNSAKSVGIYDRYGSITEGKVANLVLLRKETLETVQVILRGEMFRNNQNQLFS